MRLLRSAILFAAAIFIFNTVSLSQGVPTGSDPTCSGGNNYFFKTYGGNKDDYGQWIAPASDSGYIVSGETNSFGAGAFDGYIMKINKKGTVMWSRTVGGTGNDYIYKVKSTADNGAIGVGYTTSYGNTAGDAWLVKLDAAGNVQWTRKYGDGNSSGDVAWDVVQLSDGGYAFCGAHRFAANVTQSWVVRTDATGNVIWNNQYDRGGSDEAWGLTEDGNSVVVIGFYTASSFYDGYVMKLDKTTGNAQWTRRYDGDGRSTMMSNIRVTGSGYQVFSLVADDFVATNVQQYIWNLNTDGTVKNVRRLDMPSVRTGSYGWTHADDGGFSVVNSIAGSAADVLLTRVNAAGTIIWSKKYTRAGMQNIRAMVPSAEGGYTMVGSNDNTGSTPDSSNIYIIKLDTEGNAVSCPGSPTNEVTIGTVSYNSTTLTPVFGNSMTLNPTSFTATSPIFGATVKTFCEGCTPIVPVIPPDMVCTRGTAFFHKTYGGNKDDFGQWLAATADSGYIMAGETNSFGNGAYDAYFTKVNKAGTVIWSRTVGGIGNDYIYKIKSTADNGVIGVGYTKSYGNPAGDAWLVKLDAGGNVQWTRKYGDGNGNGDVAWDVVQLADGGYAFCGAHRFAASVTQSWVVRTDATGNVIWHQQYDRSGSDEAWALTEDGNAIVVIGFYTGASFYDGYVMKLDKATGNVQWTKRYDGDNRSTMMSNIRVTNTGYQVFSLVADDFVATNVQQYIWNLNTDGTVKNVRKINIPGTRTSSYGWVPAADGGFTVVNGNATGTADLILTQVDANGNTTWSKKYVRDGLQYIRSMLVTPDGGYIALGSNDNTNGTTDSSNIYLLKMDSEGSSVNCPPESTSDAAVTTFSVNTSDLGAVTPGTFTLNNTAFTAATNLFSPEAKVLCFYCRPEPTGSRPEIINQAHVLSVYPNPVPGTNMHLSIDAAYNDRALVTIVDRSGNILAILASAEIRKGRNLLRVELPARLPKNMNYYIHVKYSASSNTAQILLINH